MRKSGRSVSWRMIREAEAEVIKNKEDRMVPLVEEYVGEEVEKAKKASLREGILKGRQEGHLKGRQEGRLKGRHEGRLKGRQEGRLEGVRKVVLKMLKEDVDLKFISKITGLSKREINKLKK